MDIFPGTEGRLHLHPGRPPWASHWASIPPSAHPGHPSRHPDGDADAPARIAVAGERAHASVCVCTGTGTRVALPTPCPSPGAPTGTSQTGPGAPPRARLPAAPLAPVANPLPPAAPRHRGWLRPLLRSGVGGGGGGVGLCRESRAWGARCGGGGDDDDAYGDPCILPPCSMVLLRAGAPRRGGAPLRPAPLGAPPHPRDPPGAPFIPSDPLPGATVVLKRRFSICLHLLPGLGQRPPSPPPRSLVRFWGGGGGPIWPRLGRGDPKVGWMGMFNTWRLLPLGMSASPAEHPRLGDGVGTPGGVLGATDLHPHPGFCHLPACWRAMSRHRARQALPCFGLARLQPQLRLLPRLVAAAFRGTPGSRWWGVRGHVFVCVPPPALQTLSLLLAATSIRCFVLPGAGSGSARRHRRQNL